MSLSIKLNECFSAINNFSAGQTKQQEWCEKQVDKLNLNKNAKSAFILTAGIISGFAVLAISVVACIALKGFVLPFTAVLLLGSLISHQLIFGSIYLAEKNGTTRT